MKTIFCTAELDFMLGNKCSLKTDTQFGVSILNIKINLSNENILQHVNCKENCAPLMA